MLKALDIFFTVFHTLFILFNLFGWMSRRFARWNFITLMLTFISWTLLGVFYGFGYCPFTDWHWSVLRQLDYGNLPPSYIQFIIYRLTGWLPPADITDALTVAGLILALGASVYVNFIKNRKNK